jgi:hypothetical protein
MGVLSSMGGPAEGAGASNPLRGVRGTAAGVRRLYRGSDTGTRVGEKIFSGKARG